MYQSGKKSESVAFFKKLTSHIQNEDKRVELSLHYSAFFDNDPNPNPQYVLEMLELSKNLEKDSYENVSDKNKSTILFLVYKYADMLNERQTADEYWDKFNDLMSKIYDID